MLIIRSLLSKYIRHYLPHCLIILALWFVSFSCEPLLFKRSPTGHFETGFATMMTIGLLPIATLVAWGLFISFIVHEAPLTGSTEFWMTRPISRRQLFTGKFIITVLFFALIPSVALVAGRAFGLLPPYAAAFAKFATLPHIFTNFLVISLCIMLPASLTRDTTQFVFTILGITLALFVIPMFAAKDFVQAMDGMIGVTKNHTALNWTLKTVLIAGLTAIIYNQYVRRNKIVTVVATALLALLLIGIWQLWPVVPAN